MSELRLDGDGVRRDLFERMREIGRRDRRVLEALNPDGRSAPGAEPKPSAEPELRRDKTRSLEARAERLEQLLQETRARIRALRIETRLLEQSLESAFLQALGIATGSARRPSDPNTGLEDDGLEPDGPNPDLIPAHALIARPATFTGTLPESDSTFTSRSLCPATSWLEAATSVPMFDAERSENGARRNAGAVRADGVGGNEGTYAGLAANKRRVLDALEAHGATPREKATIMAIGMQETNGMNAAERDRTKDGSSSENVSAFNLSTDLVKALGYTGNPRELNDPGKTEEVVELMLGGIRRMGSEGFLNYVRGGRTAYQDGSSYGAAEYRSAIRSSTEQILRSPELLSNNHRVAENVAHV